MCALKIKSTTQHKKNRLIGCGSSASKMGLFLKTKQITLRCHPLIISANSPLNHKNYLYAAINKNWVLPFYISKSSALRYLFDVLDIF
jgi:hypothetical protein